jgi:hypothetical protein
MTKYNHFIRKQTHKAPYTDKRRKIASAKDFLNAIMGSLAINEDDSRW